MVGRFFLVKRRGVLFARVDCVAAWLCGGAARLERAALVLLYLLLMRRLTTARLEEPREIPLAGRTPCAMRLALRRPTSPLHALRQ